MGQFLFSREEKDVQKVMQPIRQLAIAVLNDGWGIPLVGWNYLRVLLEQEGGNEDILKAVDASEGRFYLPEDWQS